MNADTALPRVELPAPGPALTLHMAADRLRGRAEKALARMARNDYWSMGWRPGIENAVGGEEGELAACMSPEFALELADWLDAIGRDAMRHAAKGCGNDESEIACGHPLTIAQRILAEAS